MSRATRLLAWIAEDEAVRERLAADGSLFDGYHPEMQAVHEANARALREMVDADGWPDASSVGIEASDAAWRIVQHAIGLPDFQRGMLSLLRAEADAGRVPSWQVAYLEDRIAVHEGRPQVWGTQFDWDDAREMSPLPIAEPEGLDERRAAIGLPPLGEAIAAHRARLGAERPPGNLAARRAACHAWAVSVGWRRG